jgi:hypothetical protein
VRLPLLTIWTYSRIDVIAHATRLLVSPGNMLAGFLGQHSPPSGTRDL